MSGPLVPGHGDCTLEPLARSLAADGLRMSTKLGVYILFLAMGSLSDCLGEEPRSGHLPFESRPTLVTNVRPFLDYKIDLNSLSEGTRRRILLRDTPQPDPTVFHKMPESFQEFAVRKPEKAWSPDGFYNANENLMYGASHQSAWELETCLLGDSVLTYQNDFPQWRVNAFQDLASYLHGGSFGKQGLRFEIAERLNIQRTPLLDTIAREFLQSYVGGKNLPPIQLGSGKASLEGTNAEEAKLYSIQVPEDPYRMSPFMVIRHELDHLLADHPQTYRRCFGPNKTELSAVEFISLADAALSVVFDQEQKARIRLQKEGIAHPRENLHRYRQVLREVRRDDTYQQMLTFPSGYQITVGELGELARAGGMDLHRGEIKTNVVQNLLRGRAILKQMLYGGRENDPAHFKERRFEGGLVITSPPGKIRAAPPP